MTARRHPQRARPVRVRPPELAGRLATWARGIEALSGGVGAAARGARTGPIVEIFHLLEEREDLLRCERPRTAGVIALAKPPVLRGAVATRTVNGEAQEILPAYASPLYGVYVPGGALGLAGVGTELVYWLDLNVDARMWAEST